MTVSRRGLLAGTFGIGALAALAACSTDNPGASVGNGLPRNGGTLRVGVVGLATKLQTDPHNLLRNESDMLLASLVFDPLTVPGADRPVAPRLAASWTADPAQRVWTFTIADKATFHDGSPVRPEDLVWSLQRLRARPGGYWKVPVPLEGITVAGPNQVSLAPTEPDSQLPLLLRMMTFVLKEGTSGLVTDSPGSGPFVLESYHDGNARLRRNPQWYGGAPYLDAIEVVRFDSLQALSSAIDSGQIDLASNVGAIAARVAAGRKDLAVVRRKNDLAVMLAMQSSTGPFSDPRARQAIRLGIDRPAMVRAITSDYGTVGNDILGAGDPDYGKDFPQRARDVGKAKQLLAEAGFDTRAAYTIYTKDEAVGEVDSAKLMATQLRDIGLTVDVSVQESTAFYDKYWKKAPLTTVSWGTNDSLMFYAGKILQTSSSSNETGFHDAEFDQAYLRVLANGAGDAQNAALHDLQRIEYDRGPYLCWGLADGIDIARPAVHGLPQISGYGRVQLEKTWLAG